MSSKLGSIRPSVWFVTVFSMFLGRGLLNATWTSRGPQIRESLGVSIADMGIIATVFAAGAIIGVVASEYLVTRFGSRRVAVLVFTAMPLALVGAIVGIQLHSFVLVAIALFFFGLPFGSADFVSNIEGSELDRTSTKSRLPMLHGGYSIGVLAGALLTGLLIVSNVSLEIQFLVTAIAVGGFVVYRAWGIPSHHGKHEVHESGAKPARAVLTPAGKRRTSVISAIAFAFVFAEGAAAIFIPLALTEAGRTPAEAAFAYTLYSLGMATARVIGGKIVDRVGRRAVVLYSSIVCAVGVGTFSFAPFAPVEYVAGLLWGFGGSLTIAMCVSAISDNKKTSTRAQSTLWTWVYFANLAVGPVLGGIAAVVGIFASFAAPVLMLVGAAAASSATKPDPEVSGEVSKSS